MVYFTNLTAAGISWRRRI